MTLPRIILRKSRGYSLMVKFLPSKQATRVRFPLPAVRFVVYVKQLTESFRSKTLNFGQISDTLSRNLRKWRRRQKKAEKISIV